MFCQTRNWTRLKDIVYAIHLYFLGLSSSKTSKALSWFVKGSHMTIRDRIQEYQSQKIPPKGKNDERVYYWWDIKQGRVVRLHLAVGCNQIESKNKQILARSILIEKNMLIAEKLISGLVKILGQSDNPFSK